MQTSRLVISLFALTAVLTACGTGSSPATQPAGSQTAIASTEAAEPTTAAGEPTPAAGEATPGTALTACEIVAPADIEAVLGLDAGTVEEGTLKQIGTTLDPAENECKYDADWGGLVVSVTPTKGVNTFNAVEKVYGDDAEKLTGIGDGALWFEDYDRGYFLKGSVHVLLQFTFIADNELTSFRDPTVALGTAAIAKI